MPQAVIELDRGALSQREGKSTGGQRQTNRLEIIKRENGGLRGITSDGISKDLLFKELGGGREVQVGRIKR